MRRRGAIGQAASNSHMQRGVLGLQEGCKRLDLLFLLEMLLEVKDAIKKTRLSPHGQRPVVCIDEAQVTWQTKHNSMCRMD